MPRSKRRDRSDVGVCRWMRKEKHGAARYSWPGMCGSRKEVVGMPRMEAVVLMMETETVCDAGGISRAGRGGLGGWFMVRTGGAGCCQR